jgi:signal transduction histidine kinase
LENARLLAQERQQRQIAESFSEVVLALNSSLEQATVLAKILEQLKQVITCDGAGILLQQDNNLILLADTTNTPQDIGFPVPLASDDPAARAFKQKLPLIIADVHQEPGWAIWEGGEKIRAWMGAPLLINGQPIGVLTADSFKMGTFREEDTHILQIFANQAAIAITNARLYASAQQELAERRQAEEALKQARDHALTASRLKTELLAKVSHELRTPLGAIIGFAEMIDVGVYGSISIEQHQAIAEIIDSSLYLTRLVNELLDQAHFESGRLKLDINTFTPAALVEPVLSKMKVLAQNKGISLTSTLSDNLPALLWGDLARLQQILVNLVSNAIKFTAQGTVQVRLFQPDADHWAIQVADTGIGIPREAQAYIFEPFRQVDGSMTRTQVGSGLG